MIFRQFANDRTGSHSYLIASCDRRGAAIINPNVNDVDRYLATIEELNLHLVYTLETSDTTAGRAAAAVLTERTGARRVAPVGIAIEATPSVSVAKVGGELDLEGLKFEVVNSPDRDESCIAYRVLYYTFAGHSVLIDYHESTGFADSQPENLFEHIRSTGSATVPAHQQGPIRNFRVQRKSVSIQRLILEDLHTSIAEQRFTPKEERVVLTYVRHLEDNGFKHPSAAELSVALHNIDRTAIHVLVHNIRWKQIDLDRMPLVLAGQTSKWLKGLQTEPEFTSHEKEFLNAYLSLVQRHQQPPSGPDVATELGGQRSVQWVRKRAHTIRRKQRAFRQPILVLTRKSGDTPDASFRREASSAQFDLNRRYA